MLVCEKVNDDYGDVIVKMLNTKVGGYGTDIWFRLVPDNYILKVFVP